MARYADSESYCSVNNEEVDNNALYTQPEDIYSKLSLEH